MDNTDGQNEQPVQDESSSDEVVQADNAPVADNADSAVSQDSADNADDATSQSNNQSNDSDSTIDSRWSDSQVNESNLPVSEDGSIDPIAYKDMIKQELRQEARFESQERKAWESLESKYPELKDKPNLRKIILSHRINDVQSGGNGSLMRSAKDVMDEVTGARSQGKTDARVNVKTEKRAGLNRATAPRNTANADLRTRAERGDQGAIHEMLTGWVADKKI